MWKFISILKSRSLYFMWSAAIIWGSFRALGWLATGYENEFYCPTDRWNSTEKGNSPEVQWYGLQTMLEQAKSDVLILLDCCAAASSATGNGTGITEIIAACGFEAWAPGVGQHSFTRSLIDELRYLRRTSPYSTSLLHNKVLSRVEYWKPRYDSSARHQEMRKTPIYIVISNEPRPRSIELEPRLPQLLTVTESNAISPESPLHDSAFSSLSLSADASSSSGPASESSCSSISEVWPDKKFDCPKVLISVALEEEQWLSVPQWADWMRSIPGFVRYANVEGIYKSGSTLLLLSIPIAVWNLIPPSSAVSFIGFSESPNLLNLSCTVETDTHQVHVVNQRREDVDLKLSIMGSMSEDFEKILKDEQFRLFFEVYLEEIAVWMDIFDSAKTVSDDLCSNRTPHIVQNVSYGLAWYGLVLIFHWWLFTTWSINSPSLESSSIFQFEWNLNINTYSTKGKQWQYMVVLKASNFFVLRLWLKRSQLMGKSLILAIVLPRCTSHMSPWANALIRRSCLWSLSPVIGE